MARKRLSLPATVTGVIGEGAGERPQTMGSIQWTGNAVFKYDLLFATFGLGNNGA
jgi:hypothetical protein